MEGYSQSQPEFIPSDYFSDEETSSPASPKVAAVENDIRPSKMRKYNTPVIETDEEDEEEEVFPPPTATSTPETKSQFLQRCQDRAKKMKATARLSFSKCGPRSPCSPPASAVEEETSSPTLATSSSETVRNTTTSSSDSTQMSTSMRRSVKRTSDESILEEGMYHLYALLLNGFYFRDHLDLLDNKSFNYCNSLLLQHFQPQSNW